MWREMLAEESKKLFNFKDQRRQSRLDAAEKFGLWLISTNLGWHLAEDMVMLKRAVFWEVCTPQNQECCSSSVCCSLPVDHGYPWTIPGFLKVKGQSLCMAGTKSGMKPWHKCHMFCPFPPRLCNNLRNWVYSWEVKCLPLSLACTWLSFDTSVVSAHPVSSTCWPPQHWCFSPLFIPSVWGLL